MKKRFSFRRKKQPAAPPALYSFPQDIEKVKGEASSIAVIVLEKYWPDQVITSRLLLEMSAAYSVERQQEWAKERRKQLCNDLAAYRETFVQAFADSYETGVLRKGQV